MLVSGHIARSGDREGLRAHFERHRWNLFDDPWVRDSLAQTVHARYEHAVAIVVAKLLSQVR